MIDVKSIFSRKRRGAGLISVIITIAFIALLASALLYLTYVNLQIKSADYESRQNFYYAEEAMTVRFAEFQAVSFAAFNAAYAESGYSQDAFAHSLAEKVKTAYPIELSGLNTAQITNEVRVSNVTVEYNGGGMYTKITADFVVKIPVLSDPKTDSLNIADIVIWEGWTVNG
ncbi:MAG: hypothetical protein LBN42_01450 [Oscillospiraceae bacterium]|jgi:hypothetical protein|nr:hypothetical protein [Oscillospiraceae bacterium]